MVTPFPFGKAHFYYIGANATYTPLHLSRVLNHFWGEIRGKRIRICRKKRNFSTRGKKIKNI
jgi:hypothetical protein